MGRTDDLAQSLARCISTALAGSRDIIPSILSQYGLDSATDSNEKSLAVANFCNDIGFAHAAKAYAEAWSSVTGTSTLSHFTCPNPWDGAWKGHATHGLDAAFILQNYNSFLPSGQRTVAERMGRDMVDFVVGKSSLPRLQGENGRREMLYFADSQEGKPDESKALVSEMEFGTIGRRGELDKIVAGRVELLDQLMQAMGMFLSGA